MSGSFLGLQIGRNSIYAQRKSIEVTSHNIANVNTEGYSRQKAVVHTANPYLLTSLNTPVNPSQIGTGVMVDHIQQFRDQFIDAKVTSETSTLEWKETADMLMKQIETIINEPGSSNLRDQLDKYWAAWQDLSTDASNTALRRNLLEETQTLTFKFQEIDEQLKRLYGSTCWTSQGSIENQIKHTVSQINNLANQIGDLNKQISRGETSVNRANDLRDQRQKAIEELAELINVDVYYNKEDKLSIYTGPHPLVQHDVVKEINQVIKDGETPSGIFSTSSYPELSDKPSVASAALLHTAEQRNLTVAVGQLAQEHKQHSFLTFHPLTGPLSDFGITSGNFYVNEREFFLDADKMTLHDLADLLDQANIDMKAYVNDAGQLAMESTQTGTAYSIKTANGRSNLFTVLNLKDEQLAKDARFNINGREYVTSGNVTENLIDGVKLELNGTGVAHLELLPTVTSGKLKGLLEVRDGALTDTINELNKLAYVLITETNQLHRNGYGLDGETNRNFFDPIIHKDPYDPYKDVIQNMSVAENIVQDLQLIAASGATFEHKDDRLPSYNGDGDGSTAIKIAQLKHTNFFNNNKSNFNDFYNEIVTDVAIRSQRYEREADYSRDLMYQLDAKRAELSGVSLDEELSNLVKFQHAYNAAAKIINVTDEMLDVIVNRLVR